MAAEARGGGAGGGGRVGRTVAEGGARQKGGGARQGRRAWRRYSVTSATEGHSISFLDRSSQDISSTPCGARRAPQLSTGSGASHAQRRHQRGRGGTSAGAGLRGLGGGGGMVRKDVRPPEQQRSRRLTG